MQNIIKKYFLLFLNINPMYNPENEKYKRTPNMKEIEEYKEDIKKIKELIYENYYLSKIISPILKNLNKFCKIQYELLLETIQLIKKTPKTTEIRKNIEIIFNQNMKLNSLIEEYLEKTRKVNTNQEEIKKILKNNNDINTKKNSIGSMETQIISFIEFEINGPNNSNLEETNENFKSINDINNLYKEIIKNNEDSTKKYVELDKEKEKLKKELITSYEVNIGKWEENI